VSVTGVDVSKWQATTPNLGHVEFLIARATIGTQRDERFDQHIANARKAGIVTGAYHFNWADVSVAGQADAFLLAAGDVDLLALDVEGVQAFSRSQAAAFIDRVQAAGRKIGLYHSLSGYFDAGQDWDWVAYWADQSPPRHWDVWQFGPINGVDGNRYNGSLAELHVLAGTGGSMAELAITDVTTKIVDIPKGAKRLYRDGRPDGWVADKLYMNKPSPYGVGKLRGIYAADATGARTVRLIAATNLRDVPGAVVPDATPYSQDDVNEAYNAGVDAAAVAVLAARR
jgi:glycosyl hydrolase family 25